MGGWETGEGKGQAKCAGRARARVGRDGDVHVRRRGAAQAEEALAQIRRYRQYHLSWRQLQSASRLVSRRAIVEALRVSGVPQ